MEHESGIMIKNRVDGTEYSVSLNPVIEISVVMPITTDLGAKDGVWENKLREWFLLIAMQVIRSRMANKIVELALEGKVDSEMPEFRKENDWIDFVPYCSLKMYPIRNGTGAETVSVDKMYGWLIIDIPKVMQNLAYVAGDISKEVIQAEMKQMAFEVIVGVLANIEDYLPLNNAVGKNQNVPVWCDVVSDEGKVNCFHKANMEKLKNCVGIGVDMVIRKENWEWDVTERPNGYVREVILPLEKLTEKQEISMNENDILVAHGYEEFLEVIWELVSSMELILK